MANAQHDDAVSSHFETAQLAMRPQVTSFNDVRHVDLILADRDA